MNLLFRSFGQKNLAKFTLPIFIAFAHIKPFGKELDCSRESIIPMTPYVISVSGDYNGWLLETFLATVLIGQLIEQWTGYRSSGQSAFCAYLNNHIYNLP